MSDPTRRLGGSPPPEITALGPAALETLDELVAGAERRQRAELAGALDHALRLVPRPLRPVIKKIVGVR